MRYAACDRRNDEAHRLGLVNHVVPLADIAAFTQEMAHKIADLTPVVHRVHKEIVQIVLADPGLNGLTPEHQALAVSPFDTADFQEGWQAFLEKRAPQFRGS